MEEGETAKTLNAKCGIVWSECDAVSAGSRYRASERWARGPMRSWWRVQHKRWQAVESKIRPRIPPTTRWKTGSGGEEVNDEVASQTLTHQTFLDACLGYATDGRSGM